MRNDVFQFIAFDSQDQDGEFQISKILLMAQTFIHGDKTFEMFADQREQFPVFFAIPAHLANGFYFMAGQEVGQRTWQAFVQQDFHAAAFASNDLASFKPRTACARLTVGK